ncbi:hypothetical protein LCGC14_2420110, partial [marine sediment metagenome]
QIGETTGELPIDVSLLTGDFREVLALPKNSVDFIFTDPPYDEESIPLYGDLAKLGARVLKPGGRFVNLETSQPDSGLIKFLFHLYVRIFVKIAGRLISGSKIAYNYLAHTIPRFYTAEKLSDILLKAGFNEVNIYTMFMGISAVHRAVK